VSHDLNPPIITRYIRFRPITWHGWIAMRVELYGCLEGTERAFLQSINQSINQPINQSLNHAVSQSVSQSINQ